MHALQLLIQGSKFQESPCTSRSRRLEWLRVKWSECCRAPSMAHLHQSTVWIKLSSIWQTIVDTVTSCATDESMGWLCNFAAEVLPIYGPRTDVHVFLAVARRSNENYFKWELFQMRSTCPSSHCSKVSTLCYDHSVKANMSDWAIWALCYPNMVSDVKKICDQSGTEQLILCSMLQRNPVTD